MLGVIRSEWLKLRSVRSNVVLLGSILVLGVGFGALASGLIPDHDRRSGAPSPITRPFDRVGIVLAGLNLGMLLAGVFAVHLVGQEYRFSTIRATFAAVPRRLTVMASKFAILIATIAVLGGVTIGIAYVLNSAILSGRGFPVVTSVDGFGRVIVGTWLLMLAYVVAGYGVGMIVRQPIGGIILVLAFPLVVEPLLGLIGSNVSKWLPYNAGSQLLQRFRDPDQFGPWTGYLYLVAFGALLCVIGAALANRRDA